MDCRNEFVLEMLATWQIRLNFQPSSESDNLLTSLSQSPAQQ